MAIKHRYQHAAGADGAPAGGGDKTPPNGGAPPGDLIDAAGGTKKEPPANGGAKPDGGAAPLEWFWSDGVKGTDKPPEWFDGKKYKTVAAQAQALPELAKKLGEQGARLKGFTGAPETYALSMPDDLKDQVEFRADDPLLVEFQGIAKEAGMSQDVFTKALHLLAKYEHTSVMPDWNAEKQAVGDRADERLKGFWEWAGATFDDETASVVKRALGPAPTPAQVFLALEAVQNAGRNPSLNPGEDVVTSSTTVEALDRKYRTVDPNTKKALIDSPDGLRAYRAEMAKIVGTGDHKIVVGGAKK